MILCDIVDLKQRDHACCTRVSQAWYRICSPFLGHTVRLHDASQFKLLKERVPHQALFQKATYIQNLDLRFPEMREVFLPRLKVLPSTGDLNTPHRDKGLYLTPQCTNLRAFHLQYVPIADWDSCKTECELNPSWPLLIDTSNSKVLLHWCDTAHNSTRCRFNPR